MELLQLRYFCTVVKYGNITKAAEELRISQPSLSKTISNLEKELGITLFDRVGKHILLNDFGKAFYKRVSTGLNSIDDGLLELADMSNVQSGHVNLLILAASNLMPELFINFHNHYPHIKLHLKHPSRHELILTGDCDLCISATPEDYTGLTNILLLKEELVLAVPNEHPLASKDSIDLIEAADCDFIAFSKGPSIRTLTDSLCHYAGFIPNIIFECDNAYTYKVMLDSKMGVALIPSITYRSTLTPNTSAIHIKSPDCHRNINLSWLSDKYMTKATSIFRDFCIEFFKDVERRNR